MEKKSINRGLIFLLIFLVVVGVFLLYSRLTFTGYVTNIANATTGVVLSSHVFSEGPGVILADTTINTNGNVILSDPVNVKTGNYTSKIFDAGQNVYWTDFVFNASTHSSSNYTIDLINNSITFYVRGCNDNACAGKDFVLSSENPELVGQYFQYKAVMQILSGDESPSFSEVNVSYYPPMSLPINIESPKNAIYNNESVLIKISSVPGAMIWFYNGTDNELYTAELNRTFSEGAHVLNVFVSYLDGNINYTNSSSVSFSVGFLHTFYEYSSSSNTCSSKNLTLAQKTANDYNTPAECQTHITSTTTTTTTTTETQKACSSPVWECFFNDTAAWSECIDGVQTRICTDTSGCTGVMDISTMPPETQSCTGGITTSAVEERGNEGVVSTEPTKKGFFSFVGSAIVGPIFKSKIGLTFVILLVLVIGGFLVYKFLLKDKLKLKFFTKKRLLSFN